MRKLQKPVEPLVLPSAIDAKEVLYLQKLVQERTFAENALQRFMAYLSQTYQIGPKDTLDVSGKITRHG